jgi:hypothetical protein
LISEKGSMAGMMKRCGRVRGCAYSRKGKHCRIVPGDARREVTPHIGMRCEKVDMALRLDLDILAVAELVAAPLVVLVDDAARLLVCHLLAQAVAGLAVDLVEARLLELGRGRVERQRAGHERELEITFSVRAAGGHVRTPENPIAETLTR